MHMTEVETHKAKKLYRCEWCWEHIKPGDEYRRYRYYDSGDAGTIKMHPECHQAMSRAASEEGGYLEWTPGQERPVTPNAGNEGQAGVLACPAR